MTAVWVRIAGEPVLQIIANAEALPFVDLQHAVHALLLDVGDLRSGGAENANLALAIENDAGQASRLLGDCRTLGREATIYRGAEAVFVGVIADIALADDCAIGVEA